MFYAILDDAGMYIASGFNATSKEDVKFDLLELQEPQVDSDEDWAIMKKMTLKQLCAHLDYTLEESESKFPDAFEII